MTIGTSKQVRLSDSSDVTLNNVASGDALQYDSTLQKWKNAPQGASINQARPEIRYTGSAWPTRASSIPSSYTGPVIYWSGLYTGIPAPSDAVAGDDWVERIS